MTRAEAIAYIAEWLKDEYALNNKDREVLNMAISALEAQNTPCSHCRFIDDDSGLCEVCPAMPPMKREE